MEKEEGENDFRDCYRLVWVILSVFIFDIFVFRVFRYFYGLVFSVTNIKL